MYLIASAYEINSKDNTNYLNTIYMDNVPLIIAANCGNAKVFD